MAARQSRPLRILVVDDEPDVRLFHRHVLADVAEVDEAASAYEALAALENGSYDVVIADLLMPGARATDLARRMRDRDIQTPIVVVTAMAEEAFREEGDDELFDDVLRKPTSAGSLLRTVWRSVVRDVTAAKAAHEAMRASERRLRHVFDRSPVGFALVDRDLRIVSANPAFCSMLGYDQHVLVGRQLATLTPDEDATRDAVFVADLFAAGHGGFDVEKRYLTSAGRPIWVRVSGAHIPNDERVAGEEVLLVVEDITAIKSAEERLTFLATHDPLTGIANRTTIVPAIETAQARAERSGSWLGVAFVDLDRFKRINDERGHVAGDEVLKAVARALYQSLRPGDTFGRVGGDEFAACCENLGTYPDRANDTAAQLAARLTDSVAEVAAGSGIDLGCSVGVVLCRDRRRGATELMSAADDAMYRVKRRGGGGIEVVFESEDASVTQ